MFDSPEFDCERNAEAAMAMAAAATGLERLYWVQVSRAWQDLGRGRNGVHRAERKPTAPTNAPTLTGRVS